MVQDNQNINIDFKEALATRYLAYATTTIKSRSLPDVRDGLKPVHRRILYAMLNLKLNPASGFKKCARVVGDVVGKFHPHGDIAIYDALVRMGQTFSSRYPLIEGQGNFGSIDGDSQAAMRYTEAKLTPYAMLLLDGLEEDAVDFIENYDESEQEPMVLPALVPNLLANGVEGIAVGLATSIPPHNLLELVQATEHILKKAKSTTLDEILAFIKGPDLPTGGIIIESEEAIKNLYAQGRGTFRLRAKYHVEELERGKYEVVVTEIPFMVSKKNLIEKLAALLIDKKLPLVETFQDQSAADIRIVITPRTREVDANVLMESIFRQSDFENRITLNMNALDEHGSPKLMSLLEVLQHHAAHMIVTHQRRLSFKLGNIEKRIETLDGFIIAYLNLDEVIDIIRNYDQPKPILQERFKLTDIQAEAILNMRLRSLRKLEEMEIKKELAELAAARAQIELLLSDDGALRKHVIKLLRDAIKGFKDQELLQRRTIIDYKRAEVTPVADIELVEKADITVLLSAQGWLRAHKGHDLTTVKYKDGDEARYEIKASTIDRLILFSSLGKAYSIECHKLMPAKGGGEPIKLIFDLDGQEEIIMAALYNENDEYIIANSAGYGFVVAAAEYLSQTKKGKQIMNLKEGQTTICCERLTGDMVATLGENRRLNIVPSAQVPRLKKGVGVILQKFKQGGLKGIKIFDQKDGLRWRRNGREYTLENQKLYLAKRADMGKVVLTKLWID